MTQTKLDLLAELGQAVWLDYIRRSLIASGELESYVHIGLRGVTSNPSIFEKAITGSNDYDKQLTRLVNAGKSVEEIYEAIVVEDIQRAADVLRPVYDRTAGADGFVSLEVSPHLARDTKGTLEEARHLFKLVDRPNLLVKVPATKEGIPAIETLIGEGRNINITLMFSLEQYDAVAEAYLAGLEEQSKTGGDLSRVASVASFFVSRVDVKVDDMLDELDTPQAREIRGKIGIANAKMAYQRFKETFQGQRWEHLAGQGARVQRVLWASTSTKDPAYPDTLYVDNLIGPHTVNTVPPETLHAFLDHGTPTLTLEQGLDKARQQLEQLAELGIDLDQVTNELLEEGIEKFAKPFESLMDSIADKQAQLSAGWRDLEPHLGDYQEAVDAALQEMQENEIIQRIWHRDHTIWQPEPTEISNRLGWLDIAKTMSENVTQLKAMVHTVMEEEYTDVLLLGMGGSSLAPDLFAQTFAGQTEGLRLHVLDSTDPGSVLAYAEALDPARTLYIVSSKSGTTAETLSFFKFFYNRAVDALGAEEAGQHFVAITDPGSPLVDMAQSLDFRAVFRNDPNIGGRYSALSFFGLVPAALAGIDVARLLDRAQTSAFSCASAVSIVDNPCAYLGATLGELAKAGRDKATFVISPALMSFGDWVEQLIAESLGKAGTGVLPVVREPLGRPELYGNDRFFVHVRWQGDDSQDEALRALEKAGHPVVHLRVQDRYDLGGLFFLWEMAVAIAGARLGVHPFNQPNVESAKQRAREMINSYQETGELPSEDPSLTEDGIAVFALPQEGKEAETLEQAMDAFLEQAAPDDYIALQAFVEPTQPVMAALQNLRELLREQEMLATTMGFGPRFLHSTGQLYKGDAGNGLFIQFTSDATQDAPIPDEAGSDTSSISFDVLKKAQAAGDRQALLDAERRVIRLHLGKKVVDKIEHLTHLLS